MKQIPFKTIPKRTRSVPLEEDEEKEPLNYRQPFYLVPSKQKGKKSQHPKKQNEEEKELIQKQLQINNKLYPFMEQRQYQYQKNPSFEYSESIVQKEEKDEEINENYNDDSIEDFDGYSLLCA